MDIRQYNDNDRFQVENCIIDFQNEERLLDPNSRPGIDVASKYLDYLLECLTRRCGKLLVIDDGQIRGYICFWEEVQECSFCYEDPTCIFLSDIYIHKELRGNGLGKTLIKEVELFAKEKNKKRIILNVLEKNNAVHMYKKYGFNVLNVVMFYGIPEVCENDK